MKYTVPAKTFLIGEYSALVGGSVLGLATGPGFEIHYKSQVEEKVQPAFHKNSPAGILWAQQVLKNPNLKTTQIEITEMFNNLGGFGRSTAEYLSALIPTLKNSAEDFVQIRKKYRELSLQSGAQASGADLAIQYFGNVTVVDAKKSAYSSTDWKLKDHDFILVSTGHKVKTHEHLAELDLNSIQAFPKFSDAVIETYLSGSAEDFIVGLSEWAKLLESNNLTHPYSLELKTALQQNSDVLCAKPCGAFGADVILLICKKEVSRRLQQELVHMNLVVQGTSADLMPGVFNQLTFKNDVARKIGDTHVG